MTDDYYIKKQNKFEYRKEKEKNHGGETNTKQEEAIWQQ